MPVDDPWSEFFPEQKSSCPNCAALEKRLAEAHGYLSRLFKSVAPQCEPSEKLIFLCTQIDNYIAGLHLIMDKYGIAQRFISGDEAAFGLEKEG